MKNKPLNLTWVTTIILGIIIVLSSKVQAQNDLPSPSELRGKPSEAEQEKLDKKESRQAIFRQAIQLYQTRNYAASEAIFRQLVENQPKEAKYYFYLGNSLFYQRKIEEATQVYQEAISLNPQYGLAYNALGFLHASQGQWDEAIAQYQKALEINPDYAEALKNLGESLWKKGNTAEANNAWKKALELYTQQGNNKAVLQLQEMLNKTSQ
ncbi:tetratricopeptide repeat protein [Planktothrix agardhii 1033]|nr:tetratricopeptide repeat protein [Planktothrix agardhii 1033]MCF3606973.1 tetratricopeptide repeat protein [Planktothrix agardhii 1033]